MRAKKKKHSTHHYPTNTAEDTNAYLQPINSECLTDQPERTKIHSFLYERLIWKPLSERVISTKRAKALGGFCVRMVRMRAAASGLFATM